MKYYLDQVNSSTDSWKYLDWLVFVNELVVVNLSTSVHHQLQIGL